MPMLEPWRTRSRQAQQSWSCTFSLVAALDFEMTDAFLYFDNGLLTDEQFKDFAAASAQLAHAVVVAGGSKVTAKYYIRKKGR